MSKVATFVSDLHLGRGDELEDFTPENEAAFVQFLERQSADHMGEEVDLVLLGDFLDIWQVVEDHEKQAANSTDIEIAITAATERERVERIVAAHGRAFTSLGQFVAADPQRRRVVCTPGNHDHSLAHTDVQKVVRKAITSGNAAPDSCVIFPHYYDEPRLRVYAEHGNQFDPNNDYDDFAAFGPESPGFYFVRLFWNRMEPKEPNVDVWWDSFRAIWRNRLWRLIKPAYRLFRQYRTDPRPFERIDVPGVPFFAAGGQPLDVPSTGRPLPECPDLLFSDEGDPEYIFSTDDATENMLRAFYHDPNNAEFRAAVDEILHEKFHGQPPPVPAEPVLEMQEFGLLQDEYESAVAGMFVPAEQPPHTGLLKGSALTDDAYDYVLLGHTHEEKEVRVKGFDATYLNTGSWSARRDPAGHDVSRLCYVKIREAADGTVDAVQDCWQKP